MDRDMVQQIVEVSRRVVASGAISANGHGNVSLRVAGEDEMYFTAGPTLRDHPAEAVVRVGLDGVLREGQLPPIQGAVVDMHTAMYSDQADVGCVIHTHSPYATAYAVAHQPIGCWVEALAMFGLADGVPVASYGPRGSEQAIANIRAAATAGCPGCAPGQPRGSAIPSHTGPGDSGRWCDRGGCPSWHQRHGARRGGAHPG